MELGGSNSLDNLWPQAYDTKPWNARVKDKLENHLHREVCQGKMDRSQAQDLLVGDWIDSYCIIFDDMSQACTEYRRNR